MHVDRIRRRHRTKSGEIRDYESRLLRRSFRKPDGSVGKETLANLSMLPAAAIDAIEAVLKGRTLVAADADVAVTRSRPHGHVALAHCAARQLGLPGLLGPAGRARDLAYGLIISRVVAPAPDHATLAWWADVTLGVDLAIAGASAAELCMARSWLVDRQDHIEATLACSQLPTGGTAFLAVTSPGPGAGRLEHGLLTDPRGQPVAVRVLAGHAGDPAGIIELADAVRATFGITDLVLVGEPGVITSGRIRALATRPGLGWLSCLPSAAVRRLAEGGPQPVARPGRPGLIEASHPDYPGERLIGYRETGAGARRVFRTAVPAGRLDAHAAVTAYQALAHASREFGGSQAADLGLDLGQPGRAGQVRGHALIGLLAARLGWQLRQTLAPLTSTSAAGQPQAGWPGLLEHLATLTRSTIRIGGSTAEIVGDPTPAQRRAFSLVGAPIPVALGPK
jgi:hypothetical protein